MYFSRWAKQASKSWISIVPANPQRLGSTGSDRGAGESRFPGSMHMLRRQDGIQHQTHPENALTLFDVSIPANPRRAGSVSLDEGPTSVAVSGNHAFVTEWIGGSRQGGRLNVIDVRNVTAPRRVSALATGGLASAVEVSGQYVYLTEAWSEGDIGRGRLSVVDVSNPVSPMIIGGIDLTGWAGPLAVSGNVACVMVNQTDLQVIDISHPPAPKLLGTYANDGMPWAAALVISGRPGLGGSPRLVGHRHKLPQQPSAIRSFRSRSLCVSHGFGDLRPLRIPDRQRWGVARY